MEKIISLVVWPITVIIIATIFLFIFRKSLNSLIDRIKKVGVGKYGLETHDKTLPQITEEQKGVDVFFRTFDNPLLLEVEENIIKDLDARKIVGETDRQKALMRELASTIITSKFEAVYYTIWGSQITLLYLFN